MKKIVCLAVSLTAFTGFAQNREKMKDYPELEKVIKQLSSDKTKLKIEEILNH